MFDEGVSVDPFFFECFISFSPCGFFGKLDDVLVENTWEKYLQFFLMVFQEIDLDFSGCDRAILKEQIISKKILCLFRSTFLTVPNHVFDFTIPMARRYSAFMPLKISLRWMRVAGVGSAVICFILSCQWMVILVFVQCLPKVGGNLARVNVAAYARASRF